MVLDKKSKSSIVKFCKLYLFHFSAQRLKLFLPGCTYIYIVQVQNSNLASQNRMHPDVSVQFMFI